MVKLWQCDPYKVQPFLEQALHLANEAMREVRRSVSTLRADVREQPPLKESIEALVDDFRQGTGISVNTNISIQASVPQQLVKTLYRVVQEALTNISKHADATNVEISISTTLENVRLVIKDNGRGFQANMQTQNKFGLQGMRERITALDGVLHLQTKPGAGCIILVELPLQNHDEAKVKLNTLSNS